uniref:cysteine-S-conjugate beta-lyase n=1 Tax=Aureoumbra lagunensis TaxID=44058 RepID=A0A7S3JYY9_9STRA|mmetsp:Transcript_12000/g.16235  ORF Transcript_12000/g.16235 Transcript_12000/m.16235 type:complete len:424 (+) Transcript_12000:40-1311(+)
MKVSVTDVVNFLEREGFGEAALAVGAKWSCLETSSNSDELHVETRLVQSYAPLKDPYGAANMPIYQTATFAQASADEFGDYDYTRSGNPTRTALENAIADAEGCARCLAFSTGMAALAAVTRLCKAGDEILLSDDSYGGTYRLLAKVCGKMGINTKYVAMDGHDGPARLEAAMSKNTKLVMVESPTNPMQRVCDLRALSKVCKKQGALLEVDNTLMSPLLSKPLTLGADIVVHSATKFIAGHSDTMCGVVCVNDPKLGDALYFSQNSEGTGLAPLDCFLALRGLKTMALRVYKAQSNAEQIAHFLTEHPKVTKVFYAARPDHPDHDIHATQAIGGGCVVCFTTGNVAFSKHIVSTTKLFHITVSFGSVHSLISCPCDMSHASIPAEVRASRDFPEDIIRVCVGVEHCDDLIADLKRALESFTS